MGKIKNALMKFTSEVFCDDTLVWAFFFLASFSLGIFMQTDFVEIAYWFLFVAFAGLLFRFHGGVFISIEIRRGDEKD